MSDMHLVLGALGLWVPAVTSDAGLAKDGWNQTWGYFPQSEQHHRCHAYNSEAWLATTVKPVVHDPRSQPEAFLPQIKKKIKYMKMERYITKVTGPSDWISSMVAAQRNGKISICLNLSDVNKAIKWSIYPMKMVEQVLSDMSRANYFSKLDAKFHLMRIHHT